MSELSSEDFLFLKKVQGLTGLFTKEGNSISELENLFIRFEYSYYRTIDMNSIINALVEQEILNFSPDGTRFKISNFGKQLFENKLKEEEDWINQGPFVKLNPEKKEEIDIKQGEFFKGYWEIINILKRAKISIKIQDSYIGINTVAMLNELDSGVDVYVLTTNKNKDVIGKALVPLALLKKQRKGKTELKVINTIHSRRIIIDDLEAYSSDDSLKDIGLHKAAKIKRLGNTEEELGNFNSAWKEGEEISLSKTVPSQKGTT